MPCQAGGSETDLLPATVVEQPSCTLTAAATVDGLAQVPGRPLTQTDISCLPALDIGMSELMAVISSMESQNQLGTNLLQVMQRLQCKNEFRGIHCVRRYLTPAHHTQSKNAIKPRPCLSKAYETSASIINDTY
jgi:hypothetical protein